MQDMQNACNLYMFCNLMPWPSTTDSIHLPRLCRQTRIKFLDEQLRSVMKGISILVVIRSPERQDLVQSFPRMLAWSKEHAARVHWTMWIILCDFSAFQHFSTQKTWTQLFNPKKTTTPFHEFYLDPFVVFFSTSSLLPCGMIPWIETSQLWIRRAQLAALWPSSASCGHMLRHRAPQNRDRQVAPKKGHHRNLEMFGGWYFFGVIIWDDTKKEELL